jgi:hypothetical protein
MKATDLQKTNRRTLVTKDDLVDIPTLFQKIKSMYADMSSSDIPLEICNLEKLTPPYLSIKLTYNNSSVGLTILMVELNDKGSVSVFHPTLQSPLGEYKELSFKNVVELNGFLMNFRKFIKLMDSQTKHFLTNMNDMLPNLKKRLEKVNSVTIFGEEADYISALEKRFVIFEGKREHIRDMNKIDILVQASSQGNVLVISQDKDYNVLQKQFVPLEKVEDFIFEYAVKLSEDLNTLED